MIVANGNATNLKGDNFSILEEFENILNMLKEEFGEEFMKTFCILALSKKRNEEGFTVDWQELKKQALKSGDLKEDDGNESSK